MTVIDKLTFGNDLIIMGEIYYVILPIVNTDNFVISLTKIFLKHNINI